LRICQFDLEVKPALDDGFWFKNIVLKFDVQSMEKRQAEARNEKRENEVDEVAWSGTWNGVQ